LEEKFLKELPFLILWSKDQRPQKLAWAISVKMAME
jgi:hypothetical protein